MKLKSVYQQRTGSDSEAVFCCMNAKGTVNDN